MKKVPKKNMSKIKTRPHCKQVKTVIIQLYIQIKSNIYTKYIHTKNLKHKLAEKNALI